MSAPKRSQSEDEDIIERSRVEDRNKKTILENLTAYLRGDFENSVSNFAPDVIWQSSTFPEAIRGVDAVRERLEEQSRMMPNVTYKSIELLASGNYVSALAEISGKQLNGFMGLPPTNQSYHFMRSTVSRFDDCGQITHLWDVWDGAQILRQLNVIPPSFMDKRVVIVGEGYAAEKAKIEARNVSHVLAGLRAFNEGSFQQAVANFAPDSVWCTNIWPQSIRGPEETERMLSKMAKLDIRFEEKCILADNETVVILLTGRGAAHGRPFQLLDLVVNKFNEQGQRIEARECFDPGHVLQKVGVALPWSSPAPGAERSAQKEVLEEAPMALPSSSSAKVPPALLAAFPSGVDPYTYKIDVVRKYMGQVGDFVIMATSVSTVPIVVNSRMMGADVSLQLHRFHVRTKPLTGRAIESSEEVGQVVGEAHLRWRSIPESYVAAPGRELAAVPFNPKATQRCVVEGRFQLNDRFQSGFRCFGTGTTSFASSLPIDLSVTSRSQSHSVPAMPVFMLSVILDVTEGSGRFQNAQGIIVANGQGGEPGIFSAMPMLLRVASLDQQYQSKSRLSRLRQIPNPEPNVSTLIFTGAMNEKNPVTFNITPQGKFLGACGHEQLRLIDAQFSVKGKEGIYCNVRRGSIAAEGDFTIYFDPFRGDPPFTFQTTHGKWSFCDHRGETIGDLTANIVDGRAFPMDLPGVPMPAFRVGGFAPIIEGTGVLAGATGSIYVNVFLSIFPRFLNSILLVELWDPERRFRST